MKLYFSLSLLLICQVLFSQNWTTHNGNNERNGLTKMAGPQNVSNPLWTVSNATPTGLGMNIYSFGERFVTSRVDFSPYQAIIECRDLLTGGLLWTSPDLGSESILYTMGFNEDAVYAHDYHSNLFYALNASDGTVKWVAETPSYTFGPMDGVIYTCERNIIINGDLGSVDESTLCLDKETGEVIWTNSNWISITPNESKAAHGDHLYLITGAINQPKQLCAVDIRTGENLYYSEELPGDADQEGPIAVSPDGTIYFRRDGGDFFAVADNGAGFDILWTYTPIDMGFFVMNFGVDHEGNILMMDNSRIYRLSRLDGSPMDSTAVTGIVSGRIAIGSDSTVYVNDTEGKYYAFEYDLQSLNWQLNLSGNYYAGPALLKDGIMVFTGSGNSIKAYQYEGPHAPVADFTASSYKIYTGESVDFTDQSSFQPGAWAWEFPGGTPSASSDQNPQGILYDEPGIYEVTLTASNAMGSDQLTKKCLIEVELLNGILPADILPAGVLSPNPASGQVSVKSEFKAGISVFSISGALVYSNTVMQKYHELDVRDYPSGIYIVRLEGQGTTQQSKLVVQH